MGTTNNGSEKDITIKLDEMKQVLREKKNATCIFYWIGLIKKIFGFSKLGEFTNENCRRSRV